MLLIDDVQFLASKAKTEEEFFHTFNALYDSGRQLVLTCDRLPSQLTGIEQRLRERFESGLVAHLTPPDLGTRIDDPAQACGARQHPAIEDDAVFELIAERVTDNVRSLEGALIRIVAHHSLTGQPIDGELARRGARRDPSRVERSPTTAAVRRRSRASSSRRRALQPAPSAIITGASRIGAASRGPGSSPIYLSRELTDAPLQRIGEAFGGRNHATVLHACKRVSDRISVNNDDAADLKTSTQVIGRQQSRPRLLTD